MKKFVVFLFFLIFLLTYGQEVKAIPFQTPKEGKVMVYFTRVDFGAFALNFRIYDKDKFLGPLSYGDYLLYECDPGEHLFWVASENRDFLEATFDANKVYVIDLEPRIGAFIAAVAIRPLNPKEKKHRKWFSKVVKNKNPVYYDPSKITDDKSTNITDALEKYNKLKEKKSSKIEVLTSDMNFENADKP